MSNLIPDILFTMNVTSPYKYEKGYLFLPLDLEVKGLHADILLFGETYYLKSEFHVSLVCVKDIISSNASVDSGTVIVLFDEFIRKKSLSKVTFLPEYRLATHLDGGKSIIQKVVIDSLDEFFDTLRKELAVNLSNQPAHVKIYTLQKNMGIGVNTQSAYQDTLEIRFK